MTEFGSCADPTIKVDPPYFEHRRWEDETPSTGSGANHTKFILDQGRYPPRVCRTAPSAPVCHCGTWTIDWALDQAYVSMYHPDGDALRICRRISPPGVLTKA